MSQRTEDGLVFEMRPIGFVRSPHQETADIPKGPGAKHRAEGTLELTANNKPLAAAVSLIPVLVMLVYLALVRRTGALENV